MKKLADRQMKKQADKTDVETGRQMKRQTVEEKTDRGRDRKIDGKTQIENCSER